MSRLTVALLYSSKKNAPKIDGEPWDKWYELDSEEDVAGYERALCAGGHHVIPLEGDSTLVESLTKYKVDICFNTCEGYRGKSREAQVPAILDMLGIPYTGSGVMTLAIALDKAMAKRVLQFHGLPTPAFQVFTSGDEALDPCLHMPLFVKPSAEGSGIGITANSICHTESQVRAQVRQVVMNYRQPALVEEFIPGREITVGMLGNLHSTLARVRRRKVPAVVTQAGLLQRTNPLAKLGRSTGSPSDNGKHQVETHAINMSGAPGRATIVEGIQVFPPLEVDLSRVPVEEGGVYTAVIKGKMNDAPRYLCPTNLTLSESAEMVRIAVETFRALECVDVARVDFRVRDGDGKPFVLEVNPLPGMTEGVSDLVMAAEAVGMDYNSLINGVLQAALQRHGML